MKKNMRKKAQLPNPRNEKEDITKDLIDIKKKLKDIMINLMRTEIKIN